MKYDDASLLIPREINEASQGVPKDLFNKLCKLKNQGNALTIANFVISLHNQVNISINYRTGILRVLVKLSNQVDENKKFIDMNHDDIISFLNSHRKPEPLDPLHKWIGTYNNRLITLIQFFKWLYNPDLPSKDRPKPDIIANLQN
jgi:hypothetical protein